VSGPNQRWKLDAYGDPIEQEDERRCFDKTDVCYALRRTFLIRGQLGLKPDEMLEIDAGPARALLLVSLHEHGARSVEKLVKSMPWQKGSPLRRSICRRIWTCT
jgi:hypothetical protein